MWSKESNYLHLRGSRAVALLLHWISRFRASRSARFNVEVRNVLRFLSTYLMVITTSQTGTSIMPYHLSFIFENLP
jgi:hypothetical protein